MMSWSPTTVPHGADATVYLVMDSFGARGTAYRETDIAGEPVPEGIRDFVEDHIGPTRQLALRLG